MDFGNLKPLNPGGALGFSKFRDSQPRSSSGAKNGAIKKELDDMDSDEDDTFDDDRVVKEEDIDLQDVSKATLSPEDVRRQGEISEGVQKIKVCALRNHFTKISAHVLIEFIVKTPAFCRTIGGRLGSSAQIISFHITHSRVYATGCFISGFRNTFTSSKHFIYAKAVRRSDYWQSVETGQSQCFRSRRRRDEAKTRIRFICGYHGTNRAGSIYQEGAKRRSGVISRLTLLHSGIKASGRRAESRREVDWRTITP